MARPRQSAVRRAGRKARPGPEPIAPTAIYTTREAARLLRLSYRALSAAVHEKRVQYRQKGSSWRFKGQWLLDFFEKAALQATE